MYYKVTKEVVEAIFNYLKTQPFQDVFQLINRLQRLEGPFDNGTPAADSPQEENKEEPQE